MVAAALALLPAYSVTDLNVDLDAYGPAYLNDQGMVAGTFRREEGGFLWNRAGLFRLARVKEVYGLNNRNQIVVRDADGYGIWEHGTVRPMVDPEPSHGLLPGGGVPVGIDDSGTVFMLAQGVEGVYSVWSWPAKRALSGAPFPNAISPDGWIAGSISRGLWSGERKGPTAFLFEKSKGSFEYDPGQPIGSADEIAEPHAVTRSHRVGGGIEASDGHDRMPFVWEAGHLVRLPIPGEQAYGEVTGLNDRGEAVGRANSSAISGAVLWRDGKIYDLEKLIPAEPAYHLLAALAINEKGQIVVTGGRVSRPFPRTTLLLATR